MKFFKSLCFLLFFVLTILSLSFSNAEAGFLSPYEGYSVFGVGGCPLCDSTVSFSVYQNIGGTTGNWITDLGLGAAPNDLWNTTSGTEAYVYMYQVINTDPLPANEASLDQYNVSYQSPGFLSGGYFYNTVFATPSSATTPVDTADDGTPSALSTVNPFSSDANARDADTLVAGNMANTAVGGGAIYPGMLWTWNVGGTDGDGLIEAGGTSSIVFLTSNTGPTYQWAETQSTGGFGAAGDVPSVVPEPVSSSLFLVGAATLGFRRFRKKFKQ
jgi:hypothetical protein